MLTDECIRCGKEEHVGNCPCEICGETMLKDKDTGLLFCKNCDTEIF